MRKKVLICDDEENVREAIKVILSHETSFTHIEATNGKEVQGILQNNPDIFLAIIDLKMPGMNGLELLAILKKDYPKIKVIMVSGYMDEETADQAYMLGLSRYITKPFAFEDFIKVFKEVTKEV